MDWIPYLEDLERVVTIVAIVVGGWWSYVKFIKGQLGVARLSLKIEGRLFEENDKRYLLITAKVKNESPSPVSLSKVVIQQEGSGVSIFLCKDLILSDQAITTKADWKHIGSYSVFTNEMWVESHEEIYDSQLYTLPIGNSNIVKLQLRLVSKRTAWQTQEILFMPDEQKTKRLR